MSWRVIVGDCVEVMRAEPADSVDAIVTDPPYALGFMGKEWDHFGDTGRGARARTERAAEVTPAGEGHSGFLVFVRPAVAPAPLLASSSTHSWGPAPRGSLP